MMSPDDPDIQRRREECERKARRGVCKQVLFNISNKSFKIFLFKGNGSPSGKSFCMTCGFLLKL